MIPPPKAHRVSLRGSGPSACFGLGLVLLGGLCLGAEDPPRGPFVEDGTMIFGSVVDARAQGPAGEARDLLTPRGCVVRAGERHWAVYDIDLLRWTAFWVGDAVTPVSMSQGSYAAASAGLKAPEGQGHLPAPHGTVVWVNGPGPGWHHGSGAAWIDDRPPAPDPAEVGLGPVRYSLGRFVAWGSDARGAWVEHEVAGSRIRERLSFAGGAWIREWDAAACAVERWVMVGRAHDPALQPRLEETEEAIPDAARAELLTQNGRFVIRVPAHGRARSFRVVIGAREPVDAAAAKPLGEAASGLRGSRWGESVETRVHAGVTPTHGVVVDPIGLPERNPWNRHVRLADLAFRPDGRAAAVTFDGDVWWIDGLGGAGDRITWRRFATGLHEPLSLVLRSNRVEVFDRNGIWRLKDDDGDDECDRVELVSHAFAQTAETREFAASMEVAPDGSYVIAKGGQQGSTTGRHNGMVLRVREGAEDAEVLAYGLRQPFLGVHPRTGWITASDQQGHYVPTTPIHEIADGRYHGFLSLRLPKEQYPAPIADPLVWIPHAVNASAASQVWLVDSRMGALEGALVHLGYYRPEVFVVRVNRRSPRAEAAVLSLTQDLRFPPLAGAVSPRDGLLYVCGFQIWGTEAKEISGLARIRPDERVESPLPEEVSAFREGILVRFAVQLDPTMAGDTSRYFVERWNYLRSAQYGSGHYRLDGSRGQDVMPPSRVRLSRDQRAVWIELADMQPVMQMRVGWTIRDAAGRAISHSACLTPRALPRFEADREGFDPPREVATASLPRPAGRADVPAQPVTAAEGRRLADLMGCVACHSTDGSTLGKVGPSWKGLVGARRRFADGTEAVADDAYLRQSMEDPAARVVAGFDARDTGMPSYAGVLTRDQQSAVILYLQTLR